MIDDERKDAVSVESYGPEAQRALKLWVVLSRCHNAIAEVSRKSIAETGLIPSEFAVLEMLHHKGPLPLQEIGRRVLLTSGSMTYVVDKLEKKGWVRRAACAKDRRVYYAELTDEGRELIASVFPRHAECIRETLSSLSEEEQGILTMLLRKLGHSVVEREP